VLFLSWIGIVRGEDTDDCSLAYNELRSVLARMIYHFDMELADQQFDIDTQNVYFMWEKQPLNVRLTRRT
jgi:hypothetical protein